MPLDFSPKNARGVPQTPPPPTPSRNRVNMNFNTGNLKKIEFSKFSEI